MMRKLAYGIFLVTIFSGQSMYGQSYTDIVRFSRPDDIGSARYMALGGAFSALGNDFSAVSMNPAGIAVYRHSEMTFSTYLRNTSVENTYYGTQASANDAQFRFSQLGIVLTSNVDDESRLSLGLRYNRTNDYGFEQRIEGTNTDGSIVDQWWQNAEAFSPNSSNLFAAGLIYEQLAADVELIGFDPNSGWLQYAWGDQVQQSQSYESRGGKGIFAIDVGYQTNNTWNFGVSLEIPTLTYEYNEIYAERNFDPSSSFESMQWTNTYNLTGLGVQLKLGAIYTPEDMGRFSVYFHSPTYWSLEQQGSTAMESFDDNGQYFLSELPFNRYSWSMVTPLKFGLGYAYVFNKSGLISIDYNVQNLSWASAESGNGFNELDYVNQDVDEQLRTWQDFRIGTEWRVDKLFLRAGYHVTTSPFNFSSPRAAQYSGGLGYKANKWGVDITYSLRKRVDEVYLYSETLTQSASRDLSDHFVVTTLYFRI